MSVYCKPACLVQTDHLLSGIHDIPTTAQNLAAKHLQNMKMLNWNLRSDCQKDIPNSKFRLGISDA